MSGLSPRSRDRLAAAAVFLITFGVFLPSLRNAFVDWDDTSYLLANPHFKGFTPANLLWMLTTTNIGHYIPVTWLSFSIDYFLWGLNPAGYHLTNILLHALNAALFFLIARRLLAAAAQDPSKDLLRPLAAAAFSSLFFSLHPLRVESVAWAFERKDVLSGFFYLASAYSYVKSLSGNAPEPGKEKAKARRWRFSSIALYALSLLSKATGITLPLALILIDVYPLGRLPADPRRWANGPSKKALTEKIPYTLMAVAAGAVTYISHENLGATMHLASYGLALRAAQAFFGISFYLEKTLLPMSLSPRYLHPSFNPFDWQYVVRTVAVVLITLVLWILRRRLPAGLAAWIFYILTLIPVIGIIPQSSQIAADRYTYLPCLSWALCAGAGLSYWIRQPKARAAGFAAAFAVLLVFARLSWSQIAVWRDSANLWGRAVALNPRDIIALDGLGKALVSEGRISEALEKFQAALAINLNHSPTHNDMGLALASQGRINDAMLHFKAAIASDPKNAGAHYNFGKALSLQGRLKEAEAEYSLTLAIDPGYARAHNNLGALFWSEGRRAEAIEQYKEALIADPDYIPARTNLEKALSGSRS